MNLERQPSIEAPRLEAIPFDREVEFLTDGVEEIATSAVEYLSQDARYADLVERLQEDKGLAADFREKFVAVLWTILRDWWNDPNSDKSRSWADLLACAPRAKFSLSKVAEVARMTVDALDQLYLKEFDVPTMVDERLALPPAEEVTQAAIQEIVDAPFDAEPSPALTLEPLGHSNAPEDTGLPPVKSHGAGDSAELWVGDAAALLAARTRDLAARHPALAQYLIYPRAEESAPNRDRAEQTLGDQVIMGALDLLAKNPGTAHIVRYLRSDAPGAKHDLARVVRQMVLAKNRHYEASRAKQARAQQLLDSASRMAQRVGHPLTVKQPRAEADPVKTFANPDRFLELVKRLGVVVPEAKRQVPERPRTPEYDLYGRDVEAVADRTSKERVTVPASGKGPESERLRALATKHLGIIWSAAGVQDKYTEDFRKYQGEIVDEACASLSGEFNHQRPERLSSDDYRPQIERALLLAVRNWWDLHEGLVTHRLHRRQHEIEVRVKK